MTCMFENRATTLRQRKNSGERPRPGFLVFDSESVIDRIRVQPGETFGDSHVFASVLEGIFPVEVTCFNDERVAFPMTSRASDPLPDILRQLRTPVERDDANVVNHLRQDHHVSLSLNDLIIAVVARGHHRWSRTRHDYA